MRVTNQTFISLKFYILAFTEMIHLMRNITIWSSAFILIILAGCGMDKSEVKEQDPSSLKGQLSPTEVLTVAATRKPFEHFINTNGKVESSKEVQVQFRISGIVSEILTNNGQLVKKGDIIAKIESQKYNLEAEKAKVLLKEKSVAFEDQITGFKGQDDEKLKIIRENIRYSSGLASAEISYEQAKLDLENTIIKAPISGIISDLNIREGNLVKADESFCLIHDQSYLRVSCDVLEADAFNLFAGQMASIQPLFEKDRTFQAKVTSINPRVNLKTGLVRVQLTLGQSKELLPGMNVGVIIKVPHEKNIIVPKEAIVVRSGKQVVFTVENELAKWNYVTTGRENGKEIEITEGLKENQMVIITNNLQLAHDAPVKEISKSGG
jgi:RND family efflux transporter MFP subunit